MKYTYELHPVEKPLNATYTLEELQQLTTLQLREICQKEKLVIGVAYKLDRSYIISIILKYRGAKLSTFVNTFVAERFDNVLEKFSSYLNFFDSTKTIQAPTRITLYKKVETTISDNYVVEGSNLFDGNIFLLDDKKMICGILNLKKFSGKFYIICNNKMLKQDLVEALYKNYSLGFLDESGSKYLYNYYYEIGKSHPIKLNCYLKPVSELLIMETLAANTSLVIDFGTSNSSAGAYMDEHYVANNVKFDLQKNGIYMNNINKVKFKNTMAYVLGQAVSKESGEKYTTEIIPTVISIKDCSEPHNIVYRFGYDALRNSRKNSYNNPASVFYGIKKWVNNYNKTEEIADEEGNIAFVSRKDIIKAYFENIISIAEQQHKCQYKSLHITSPVKQKQQFLDMYKEILSDYDIVTETALDEGIAVLYNSISNQIERNNFEDGEEYQALIIDCGGGTTDLTSCNYYIEDNQITYKLNLTTTYANGETNFGGNNITYRIFQYLKVIFSRFYNNESSVNVEGLFDAELSDIYRYVDANGHKKTYATLESLYEECEKTIPTKYYEYKNSPSEDFMKVKSNFYFLWNLAEKIKIEFYQTVGIGQTSFHEQGLKSNVNDPKILAEESWRLNVYQKTKSYIKSRNMTSELKTLKLRTDFPKVIITKEEINTLIKADIYNVIKKFIEPIYFQDELNNFNFIKLTGQTCKIDIFRDALKEFIPGRVIESSKKEKTVQDFKLTCLEGAVKYQSAQKIGLIAPTITNKAPITPYKLIAYTHTGAETIMISSLEQITKSYGFVSRNIDTESVELILRDADDKVLHKYALQTNIKNFKNTTYEETTMDYSEKIFQDDIDSIIDDEIKIFTFSLQDKWGFYVLPLARKNQTLLMGERKYFPFENDEWEINFFDGKK